MHIPSKKEKYLFTFDKIKKEKPSLKIRPFASTWRLAIRSNFKFSNFKMGAEAKIEKVKKKKKAETLFHFLLFRASEYLNSKPETETSMPKF